MSCINPIIAHVTEINKDIDLNKAKYFGIPKKIIKFLPIEKYGSLDEIIKKYPMKELLFIPCGKCLECKKAYANEKAIRCTLESYYSKNNYFITLTFKKEPKNDEQKLRELLKRKIHDLKKITNSKNLKHFSCCEHGETGNRIHYHCNFFNLELKDIKVIGNHLKSKTIDEWWDLGLTDIQLFDKGTAKYTAGYTAAGKKKTIFISQSRRLGWQYVEEHQNDILKTGVIYINGQKYQIGRWAFNHLLGDTRPKETENLMNKRIKTSIARMNANIQMTNCTPQESIYNHAMNILAKKVKKGGNFDGQ